MGRRTPATQDGGNAERKQARDRSRSGHKSKKEKRERKGEDNISNQPRHDGAHVPGRRSWATGAQTSAGLQICKAFNGKRGCVTPCKQARAHVCDALLSDGRVCEAKDHNRRTDFPQEHGSVKSIPGAGGRPKPN